MNISNSDMMCIMGKSERTCRTIRNKIRSKYGIKHKSEITVEQFCEYIGLPLKRVNDWLEKNQNNIKWH